MHNSKVNKRDESLLFIRFAMLPCARWFQYVHSGAEEASFAKIFYRELRFGLLPPRLTFEFLYVRSLSEQCSYLAIRCPSSPEGPADLRGVKKVTANELLLLGGNLEIRLAQIDH